MLQFLKKLFGGGFNAKALVNNGAVIIDVRTGPEYDRGHVRGAMNIPLDRVAGRAAEFKQKKQVVICCCQSGSRSGSAVAILKKAGVEAYNGGNWQQLQNRLN
ncbi:MAG: rhodanese-like domain-containing protein [Dinghuibacter sp.]|nr:rhodanese-like domain-containing protein [Dinghuibacter sp.]